MSSRLTAAVSDWRCLRGHSPQSHGPLVFLNPAQVITAIRYLSAN
ncbi:MAG TPA: hypothetical protein VMC83_02085 [Streptosporangiaceae bacterium]|jgi:hypothetical protein|nr:hypothetical protein [Streptosporangiaceae bacterium]